LAIHLPAQIRKELQRLETKFQQGSINEMADRIPSIKANNEDERAFISHYSAMLKKDKAEALSQHQRVAERYPKTFYGQKSLLEAAIIHSLDRNFTEAQSMLRKINAPQLPHGCIGLPLPPMVWMIIPLPSQMLRTICVSVQKACMLKMPCI
jgi:outer membrane protein assembly factor BamD (BamD/ComL family)